MDKKEKLHNAWAMADKPLVDKTKKLQRLSPVLSDKDSSDESSDSDNDFMALPKEFRPNLSTSDQCPQKQTKDANISPNMAVKNQSIQSLTAAIDKLANTTLGNCNQTSLLRNEKEVASRGNDSAIRKTGTDSKISYQIVKYDSYRQDGESFDEALENVAEVREKTSRQKLNPAKDNESLLTRSASSVTTKSKESLKYECVNKEDRRTIHLNFDNFSFEGNDPVSKDGLKYEVKLTQNTRKKDKNAICGENRLPKRNTVKRSNLSDGQITSSSELNIIKWDSSLNLTGDQDSKIEWTVVHEKTSLTVRKSLTSPRRNNNFVSKNRTSTRNFHNEKFKNSLQNEANNNQHTTPKTIRKSSPPHRNDSKLNFKNYAPKNNVLSTDDNLKYTRIVRNQDFTSDTQSLDKKLNSCRQQPNATSRQHEDDNLKYTRIVRNPDFTSDTQSLDKTLNSCRQQPNATSRQHEEDKLNRNLPCVASNLPTGKSNISDLSNSRRMPVSTENNDQNGSSQLQKGQDELNLPGVNNGRRGNLDAKLSRDLDEKKESILQYGREISDLIIGSYIALNMLISFLREWAMARKELIFQFQELGKQLKKSSKTFSWLKDVIQIAGTGAVVATAIPHPATSIAAKVVSAITTLLQTILNNKKTDVSKVDGSDEITRAMLKDNRASNELYMYGLQCSQQFDETTKLIEKFHSNADIKRFFDRENPEIVIFLRGFLEFKPNHRIFYKKLHECFQELLQTSTTYFSRKFCEPFTLFSSPAIDVIGYLGWRFRHEDFDGSSVRHELEEIQLLIQNNGSTRLEDVQKRIQNCIGILTDELEFIESQMKEISMFDGSPGDKTLL